MENKVQVIEDLSNGMRAYLRTGDLGMLPEQEKDKVLIKMCEHYCLDPVLRPFILIKLNGKEVWYPTRSATDQVAARFNLTREVIEIKENIERGILECRVRISSEGSGRVETCIAAVPIIEFGRDQGGKIVGHIMKGEAYANALMKVETKAKRRATLGWLGIAEEHDPLENERSYAQAKETEAAKIAADTAEDTPPELHEGKRRGRPSRADLEARALAEGRTQHSEKDEIHFADQVENVAKELPPKVETKHFETQPRVNGKFASKNPEPKPTIIQENEVKLEDVPLKKEPAVLPVLKDDTLVDVSPDYIKYSRENDGHKHLMKLTLENLGIDWKKVDHIKMATKVSIACNDQAPIVSKLDNNFAKAIFQDFVAKELKKIQEETEGEIPL